MTEKDQRLAAMEEHVAAVSPKLLSLSRKAAAFLDKHDLDEHTARVALCLDISASMRPHYESGAIQELAERVLALGLRFDDNGQIDVFTFGDRAYAEGRLGLDNHQGFIERLRVRRPLENSTHYGQAMRLIRKSYFGSAAQRTTPHTDDLPVYVMFVTDGATLDESETVAQAVSSSYEPLFWQFMAIGWSGKSIDATSNRWKLWKRLSATTGEFALLDRLDDTPKRFVDNADFFTVDKPRDISDEQLYGSLMNEYPGWVQQARARGLLTQ